MNTSERLVWQTPAKIPAPRTRSALRHEEPPDSASPPMGAALVGADIALGCPATHRPDRELTRETQRIARKTGAKFEVHDKPADAVRDADVLYTDVWVSMGDEAEQQKREKLFRPYQVNGKLVARAKRDAIVMHCLPAHRGLEITGGVLDGPRSVVLDQAENRLHAQKGLLEWLIAG